MVAGSVLPVVSTVGSVAPGSVASKQMNPILRHTRRFIPVIDVSVESPVCAFTMTREKQIIARTVRSENFMLEKTR